MLHSEQCVFVLIVVIIQYVPMCICAGAASPLHPNVDLASMHAVEEALHERGPLQGEGCDQEVEADAAETIALEEGHEEAETDEYHHMHVLETYTTQKTESEIMPCQSLRERWIVVLVAFCFLHVWRDKTESNGIKTLEFR